ncbi:MAG: hypothetical protein HN348_27110 [Proteobacteria bacterium]|jgi:alpha-tubulin suppressor-like RCC1 family protein|nr:hypothetical protein [Pseudomonadota bacterium]
MWWALLAGCTIIFIDEQPQPVGDGDTDVTSDTDTDTDTDIDTDTDPTDTYYRLISVGTKHLCALDKDAKITCWGDDEKAIDVPEKQYSWVAAGSAFSCGVTDDDVECWGADSPGDTSHPKGVSSVTAGIDFACGLSFTDEVFCWGREDFSPAAKSAIQIDAGGNHVCAIANEDTDMGLADGQWVCWGDDADGQTPPTTLRFKEVSAAQGHTCGISSDNPLVKCLPQDINVKEEFSTIASALKFACGRTKENEVQCWGFEYHKAPQVPDRLFQFLAASASANWACGITADDGTLTNKILCWGDEVPNHLP